MMCVELPFSSATQGRRKHRAYVSIALDCWCLCSQKLQRSPKPRASTVTVRAASNSTCNIIITYLDWKNEKPTLFIIQTIESSWQAGKGKRGVVHIRCRWLQEEVGFYDYYKETWIKRVEKTLLSREKINHFLKSSMLTLATSFTNHRFKTDKPETRKLMSQLTNMRIRAWLLTTPPCIHSPWAPSIFFWFPVVEIYFQCSHPFNVPNKSC